MKAVAIWHSIGGSIYMIANYLKIAFRNFGRNKGFTLINVSGLAIGMATCLLISLYVLNELSYDRYNEKADRMVRVVFRGTVQGQKMKEAMVMPPTAQTLKADYPEVLEATRTFSRVKMSRMSRISAGWPPAMTSTST